MTIVSVSKKFGGEGGDYYNDFDTIISLFGDSNKKEIDKIDIRKIETQCGDVVDSLQFTYNVETRDGLSHDHIGHKYGGDGGIKQVYMLTYGEQVTGISGRYGKFYNNDIKVIK